MNMPLVLLNRRRRGFTAFSPSTLFALAEPGVWYDPSDLTTLFQDTAGTTPVTAPGNTVGLMLDKSKGLALGADALAGNGNFSNPSYWTDVNGVSTISGGQLTFNGSATTGGQYVAAPNLPLVIGKYYQVTFDVVSIASGGIKIWLGTGTPTYTATIAGTHTFRAACVGDNAVRLYNNGTATTAVVDNVVIRELAGNHATQSTLASRPIYGIEPVGGRRNLLTQTDTLATQSLTVAAVAHTLAFTGTGTVTLTGASIAGPLIGTGASNRVSLTFTPTAASLTLTVVGSVTLAQLETGSTATAYQRTTTQYDVTEAGVASTSYLAFDGVDDGMVTGTITPGVDKAQIFAGVRKLSDAAVGIIAEFSPAVTSNEGSFYLLAPRAVGIASYQFASRGTLSSIPSSPSTYPAPITNLFTGISDIAENLATLRIDGTQVASSGSDQGTGNFLAYPLYLGRRGGSSLPFKGNVYSLITRFGANLDAGVITNTETWVAGKTGIVI